MNETFGCPINKAVIVMTEVESDGAVLLPSSAGENTYVADILALLLQEKNGTYNVQPAETTSSQPAPVGASPEQPPLVGAPVGQSNGETTNGETTNGETTNGETTDEQALADLIIPPTTTTVGETTNEETTETFKNKIEGFFADKSQIIKLIIITIIIAVILLIAAFIGYNFIGKNKIK